MALQSNYHIKLFLFCYFCDLKNFLNTRGVCWWLPDSPMEARRQKPP